MPITRRAALAASTLAFALPAAPALAHDHAQGDLRIVRAWTRATPPSARVAAGYMTIENRGPRPDRLVSAVFAGSRVVEVHEMAVENGVMRMRELPQGLEIPAGGAAELKPGGHHLMFIDLIAGLKEGQTVRGALVFEKAGRIEVEFRVESMAARGGGHDHGAGRKAH